MDGAGEGKPGPDELRPALDLVRVMLAEGQRRGIAEQDLVWAMVMEAVDGYVRLKGHRLAAFMLGQLSAVVRADGAPGKGASLQ